MPDDTFTAPLLTSTCPDASRARTAISGAELASSTCVSKPRLATTARGETDDAARPARICHRATRVAPFQLTSTAIRVASTRRATTSGFVAGVALHANRYAR